MVQASVHGKRTSQVREPEATLERSLEHLRLKTRSHIDAWGLDSIARWDADMEDGVISFTRPGMLVVAALQVIGAYNLEDGSWLWGWDHPSVPPPLMRDAERVRAFGEHHGLARYVDRKINWTENEAWQFTALACHLAEASGAYRGPAENTLVFMTFHNPVIRGAASTRKGA